jgi:hypothetical protein
LEVSWKPKNEIARRYPHAIGRRAMSRSQFCVEYDISRGLYDKLQRAGKGPHETNIDGVIRITDASASEWEKQFDK